MIDSNQERKKPGSWYPQLKVSSSAKALLAGIKLLTQESLGNPRCHSQHQGSHVLWFPGTLIPAFPILHIKPELRIRLLFCLEASVRNPRCGPGVGHACSSRLPTACMPRGQHRPGGSCLDVFLSLSELAHPGIHAVGLEHVSTSQSLYAFISEMEGTRMLSH